MNQQLIRLRKYFASLSSPEPHVEAMKKLLDSMEKEHQNVRFKLDRTIQDKSLMKNLLNQSIKQLQTKTTELKEQKESIERQFACKQKLFASVSHELKTPLTGIIGMLELMDKSELTESSKNYLSTIKSSADNLTAIIDNSLTHSKLNANCVQLNNVPFSTKLFFSELNNIMSIQAKAKKLELIMKNTHHLPEFLIGDKTRLFQVVSNIINNAVKFTDEGTITLTADFHILSEGSIEVNFEIRDSGIGIPDDKLDLIYESFTQLHHNKKNDGLGLGLSIVKDLVCLMKGKVDVSSKPGIGSIFRLSIPFNVANQKMAIEYQKLKTERQFSKAWKGKRFLLVEDCISNQHFCTELFKIWGISVKVAGNLKAAEALIAKTRFDCMLIDVNLSDGNSYELIKKVRLQAGKNQKTPILVTSGSRRVEIEYQLLGTAINGIISKPFYPKDIAVQLESIFQNKKPAQSSLSEANGSRNTATELPPRRKKRKFEIKERILDEIKTIFVSEGPKSLRIMSNAIRNHDWKTVCFEAHKIRSTINYVGMPKLADRTKRMEYYCELQEASKFVPREYRIFEREMSTLIKKTKSDLNRSIQSR